VHLCTISADRAPWVQFGTYTVRFCTRSSGAREMVQKRTVLPSMPPLTFAGVAATRSSAASAARA
jgi:hypothetical protein